MSFPQRSSHGHYRELTSLHRCCPGLSRLHKHAADQQAAQQSISRVPELVCGVQGCTQMTCACGHMFDWGRNLGLI